MSDLLKSALGFLNNPVGGVGGSSQGGHPHMGQHGGGGGTQGSDEMSTVGDVITFQGVNQEKKSVKIAKLIAEGERNQV